jgi:LysR substrate binding domain
MRRSGGLYVWEFEKGEQEINVRVEVQITLNSMPLILEAVGAGHGIAYAMEDRVQPLMEAAEAVRLLENRCPTLDGYHLYHPSRRQPTPAFSLLVEALRCRSSWPSLLEGHGRHHDRSIVELIAAWACNERLASCKDRNSAKFAMLTGTTVPSVGSATPICQSRA